MQPDRAQGPSFSVGVEQGIGPVRNHKYIPKTAVVKIATFQKQKRDTPKGIPALLRPFQAGFYPAIHDVLVASLIPSSRVAWERLPASA